jgi:hypothetical protein
MYLYRITDNNNNNTHFQEVYSLLKERDDMRGAHTEACTVRRGRETASQELNRTLQWGERTLQ